MNDFVHSAAAWNQKETRACLQLQARAHTQPFTYMEPFLHTSLGKSQALYGKQRGKH